LPFVFFEPSNSFLLAFFEQNLQNLFDILLQIFFDDLASISIRDLATLQFTCGKKSLDPRSLFKISPFKKASFHSELKNFGVFHDWAKGLIFILTPL
jgi:hypothetical protein